MLVLCLYSPDCQSGWKRLLLADAPRQIINALTLWAIYLSKRERNPGPWWDIRRYFAGSDLSAQALMVTTSLTVVVFAGSMLILIMAGVCYVPLLCYIRGNLKVGPLVLILPFLLKYNHRSIAVTKLIRYDFLFGDELQAHST